MSPRPDEVSGTVVLDCEGLSRAVRRDRSLTRWLNFAVESNQRVVTSSVALTASDLLRDAGLHGHKHGIDAVLAAVASACPPPVTILTSDPEDLQALCGGQVTVVKL
ncbi:MULTISPECIES: hypothetical protein [Pseudofrankia]|uniref:hypothetical protein n=1 Tax=Pseudofrankia TaxID=2994363 RepID=UPI000234B2AC|nr:MULTISPECIES: hypothetical protein [Pseudofrankia]OHV29716.1 hypothetical protein BCD49_35910 [Pseudofrankia sp. EUN1h]